MKQVDIRSVLDLLKRETNTDFYRYRRATLSRRISRRMGLQGMDQLQDYLALLEDNRAELESLRDDLLIGVTRFFRDASSWKMLENKVVKPLVRGADPDKPLRIWCPGCATGEEAYSLAMLFLEQAALVDKPVPFQIFASDISVESLGFAREGRYSDSISADVGVARLRQFFNKIDGGYRVSKQLRERVVFAEQNVLAQAPFSKLDLISCRNLLIYLERKAQQSVFSVFQFALNQGGFLFLGSSESIDQSGDLFEVVNAKHRIYRRTSVKSFPPTRREPATPADETESTNLSQVDYRQPSRIGHHVYRQLIKEFEQGVVVINRQNKVLFIEGRADLYLQIGTGELTTEIPEIFTLARDGIKARLRTMIRKAHQTSEPVEDSCQVKRDEQSYACRIKIRKLHASISEDAPLVISFEPLPSSAIASQPRSEILENIEMLGDKEELRHELMTTREQLNTTIAQLETANEELKASNEEALSMNEQLQSGNEELETSKEELQSLNEELTTLNHQLELKLTELQHTTDDLNNLLTSAGIPTIFLDTNLRIRRFTPSCEPLYNFIPTDVGRPLADIVRLHDDEQLIDDARGVLEELVPKDKELVCTDGRCFIRRILPYRTEDDRIQGVVVTFADVTELSAAKEELAESLAVLNNVYKSAPVGLAFMTRELEFVRINDQLAAINGFPVEDHIGKKLRDILPEKLADEVTAVHEQIIETGEPIMNVEIQGKTEGSRSSRIWEASYMPVKGDSGIVIGINTVVQDVTASRHNERELTDSRERLEIALSAGRMGTWHWVIQNGHIEWSDHMFKLLGVNRDEFRATRESFINRVHPDDRKRISHGMKQAMESTASIYQEECRIIRDSDRQTIWVERRAVIRRDEHGHPVSMTGVTIDVTQRHQHEQSLKRAKDAAEAANQSRGEFLANMSHEIRTPMTAILGYADMLAGHIKDPDNLQCVETIRRNGRFLLEIIDDILDLSKIDAGKFHIERERIEPERILADIISLMNVRAEEKKLALEVEMQSKLPRVIETDGKRLRQILLNLIGNAIKFTNEGKVRLLARFEEDNQSLQLSVEDTGIGIAPKKVRALFEPFTQADGSVTRKFGGTGLGLAISRRLAKILGGDITVESLPGRGSTFTLSIDPGPVEDVEFAEIDLAISRQTEPTEEINLDGLFLVVDDRRDIRYLAQHIIESAGGIVSTANDGRGAVEAVQTAIDEGRPFHAVCMDMQMPVLDGYEATREIRRRNISVPIVALTAHAMQGDEEACLEAGCTAFVSKPIDKAVLLQTLDKVTK